jgi:hypothetical protein
MPMPMPGTAAASPTRVAHLLSRLQNLCAEVLNALTGGDANLGNKQQR